MLAILTVLSTISPLIVVGQQLSPRRVCQSANDFAPYDCNGDDANCNSLDDDIEECISLGGVDRCYWKDPNIIDVGEGYSRECTFHGDAECLVLDGTMEFIDQAEFGPPIHYTSCLRCCPNSDVGQSLCTETISTGEENCGSLGESMLWSFFDGGFFTNVAPCCPGEVCLDNVAGICGEASEECDACTIWSFIVESGPSYHSGDSCGSGLVCLDDGGDPLVGSKPQITTAELNRRMRRLQDVETFDSHFDEVTYTSGICVPSGGLPTGECTNDEGCSSCMRCCDGQCVRQSSGETCGLDGRGPCCYGDMCCNNQCESTDSNGDDGDDGDDEDEDEDSDDSADAFLAVAELNGGEVLDSSDKTVSNKYEIHLSSETQTNLIIMVVIVMVFISVSVFCCWFNQKKTTEYGIDDKISTV